MGYRKLDRALPLFEKRELEVLQHVADSIGQKVIGYFDLRFSSRIAFNKTFYDEKVTFDQFFGPYAGQLIRKGYLRRIICLGDENLHKIPLSGIYLTDKGKVKIEQFKAKHHVLV